MAKSRVRKRTLPSKLSKLIRVALKDEDRAFKSPNYRIDMTVWHGTSYSRGVLRPECSVCLAGAVMAGTLKVSPSQSESPSSLFEYPISNRLRSLDSVRTGKVADALREFNNEQKGAGKIGAEIKAKIGVPPIYRSQLIKPEKREQWREWMAQCADELEARGR